MPRPHTSDNSFKHPRYSRGRIYIVSNIFYVEMPPRGAHRNPIRVSTKLYARTERGKVIKENLDAALEVLKLANWLYDNIELPANTPYRGLLNAFGATPVVEEAGNVLIEHAWQIFSDIKFEDYTEGSRQQWANARAAYLPKDVAHLPKHLPSTRKDVEGLAKFILHQRKRNKFAATTTKHYESCMRSFFTFCVKRDFMPANPFDYISSAKGASVEAEPFTIAELHDIDRFWCARAGGDDVFTRGRAPSAREYKNVMMRLLVRFLFITGARIQEALSTRTEWFTDEYVKIGIVKGASRGKKARYIPHGLIPGSVDVVADILHVSRERGGKVFPWPTAHSANSFFNLALSKQNTEAIRIPARKRFHAIRKAAENYWRDDLGISEEVRIWMIGHTAEVARDVYMIPPSLRTHLSLTAEQKPTPSPVFSRLFVDD